MKTLMAIAALCFALVACSSSGTSTGERAGTSEAVETLGGGAPNAMAFADGAQIAEDVSLILASDGLTGSRTSAKCAADRMVTELGSTTFTDVVAAGTTADLTLSPDQAATAVDALFECGGTTSGLAAGIAAGGVDADVAACIAAGVDTEIYRSSMVTAFGGSGAADLADFARELNAVAATC